VPAASERRVHKTKTEADIVLSNGARRTGWFFLAESALSHTGHERLIDLLNTGGGFVPFAEQHDEAFETTLINTAHVVTITPKGALGLAQDAGYAVSTPRLITLLLSTGDRVTGCVQVVHPHGRDRVSDYTRAPERFRYVETTERVLIVNMAHILELSELEQP
jgi:hypothetical protein